MAEMTIEQQRALALARARMRAAEAEPPGFMDQMVSAVTDIPGEIASAATSAASAVNATLNPFSEAYRKRIDERVARAQQEGLVGPSLGSGLADTGRGLTSIPAIAYAPITGAARSLIGHPYSAITGMPYEEAKQAVDTAMMAVAPRAASPRGLRTQPAKLPTSQELMTEARAAYQSPEVKGLQINPQSTDALAQTIHSDLTLRGFRPTPASAPSTLAEIERLRPAQGVAAVAVDDLDAARRALGMTAKQRDFMGQPTPDAAAAQIAIQRIDDYLSNLPARDVLAGDAVSARQKLLEARGNYAAGKRSSEIDFRLNKAERQAAKSGSGMNIENARRQKIDQVSDYGLTPEEIALKDKIVLGTPTRNMLRTVGKLGVDGGLSLAINTGLNIGTGGAYLPVSVGGTAARLIGQWLTKRQINQLNEMIRARSPLAQSRPPQPVPLPNPLLTALYPSLLPPGLLSAVPQLASERR